MKIVLYITVIILIALIIGPGIWYIYTLVNQKDLLLFNMLKDKKVIDAYNNYVIDIENTTSDDNKYKALDSFKHLKASVHEWMQKSIAPDKLGAATPFDQGKGPFFFDL